MLYNGKNKAGEGGDTRYTETRIMPDKFVRPENEPTKILRVLDEHFLIPQDDFEKKIGQYPAGTDIYRRTCLSSRIKVVFVLWLC